MVMRLLDGSEISEEDLRSIKATLESRMKK